MRVILVLVCGLISQSALSADLKLNYSLFFGYMKTMYKLDYQHVTTAFYLTNKTTGKVCYIANAEMVVDEKREQIKFEQAGRLLPFYSDEHRKDGAMIEVSLLNPQEKCDLNVTIMAKKSELAKLNNAKLQVISSELEGVLRKNAGMIAKYFLPEFNGVRLQLSTLLTMDQREQLDKRIQVLENGDLLISNVLLSQEKELFLSFSVKRISPWILTGSH